MKINRLEPLENQEVRDEATSVGEGRFEYSLAGAKLKKKKNKKKSAKKKLDADGYSK